MPIYSTIAQAHSLGLGLKWGRSPSYLMESVFHRMRDVPSSAIFCSSLIIIIIIIIIIISINYYYYYYYYYYSP